MSLGSLAGRRRPDFAARWGVVSFYGLEESSGTRSDSYSTNHLSSSGVTQAASGKVGNAAQFTRASSQYLSVASNASLQTGDVDFWWAGWAWFDTLPGDIGIASKWGGSTNEWLVEWLANTLYFHYGTANITRPYTTTGAWTFIMGYHDASANTIGISLNGAAFTTTAHSGGNTAGNSEVALGRYSSAYHDGRLDQVVFGKSPPLGITALATEIRDELYFSEAGRTYTSIRG